MRITTRRYTSWIGALTLRGRQLARNESGATIVEYALLTAIAALLLIAAVFIYGPGLRLWLDTR